jgi:hypothetical protein
MNTVAEAVHRGIDGSVHYLASTPTGSQLIVVTDPVLGVRQPGLDGPCRLTDPGGNTGSVVYESISAKESTTITVCPGRSRATTALSLSAPTGHSLPAVLDMTLICGRNAPSVIR